MNWTDELLTAFVDGELDPKRMAACESALAGDAAMQFRVTALRAQRRRVEAAFVGALDEPVPDRLTALLATPRAADVIKLGTARGQHTPFRVPRSGWGWGWGAWGGMAASVLVGLLLGGQWSSERKSLPIAVRDSHLVASGIVDRALSTQLAGDPSAGPVAVRLSFIDRQGDYCRTFSTAEFAGLACRRGDAWNVQVLAPANAAPAQGMRQAATPLPAAVLAAVDARIAGDALDASRERQARDRSWLPRGPRGAPAAP